MLKHFQQSLAVNLSCVYPWKTLSGHVKGTLILAEIRLITDVTVGLGDTQQELTEALTKPFFYWYSSGLHFSILIPTRKDSTVLNFLGYLIDSWLTAAPQTVPV